MQTFTLQNAPGSLRMSCVKPERSRPCSSGGALRRRSLRSVSPSVVAAREARSMSMSVTGVVGEMVRRARRVSILRAVSSREAALNASRFRSVSSTGDVADVRGTTVVVTCSLGGGESGGDAGGRHGLGERIASFRGSGSELERTGNWRRPTGVGG